MGESCENHNNTFFSIMNNVFETSNGNPIVGFQVINSALDAMVNGAAQSPAKVEEKPQSFIKVQSLSNFVKEGKEMEVPKVLAEHVLVEHETTILFADTGLGKSTLAIQIAIDVAAKGVNVLSANFELSQLQLAQRFEDKLIPKNLFITAIDYTLMHDVTDQTQILGEIEQAAIQNKAEVVIIDNLTNLCINAKEGSEAGNIMLQLLSLRMVHNWTMLVLAHVPKRKPGDPLTLNDLAGSKIISNLADNVVGLNRSKLGKEKRYLIQLKSRSFAIELDSKHVQELSLTDGDGYLHFEFGDYAEERMHLPRSRDEKAELEADIVKELKELNGLSYRDIADKLGTSLATVQRVAKNNNLNRKADKDKQKVKKAE